MRNLLWLAILIGAVTVGFIEQRSSGIKIVNSDGLVKFSAVDATQVQPFIELGSQTNVAFQVTSNGALVLGATTNQITFGATNTAPASGTVILYVSVQVAGDTNVYRLGLTK